ncbi:hypothetical protein VNI00_016430 [Paramarasmius palmivorus]|uniref:Uncharacterized protein n=1 Tax=Paramarasmius palmivorus TaxID=297713 RepID=A0AAW0BCT0_9AGAR
MAHNFQSNAEQDIEDTGHFYGTAMIAHHRSLENNSAEVDSSSLLLVHDMVRLTQYTDLLFGKILRFTRLRDDTSNRTCTLNELGKQHFQDATPRRLISGFPDENLQFNMYQNVSGALHATNQKEHTWKMRVEGDIRSNMSRTEDLFKQLSQTLKEKYMVGLQSDARDGFINCPGPDFGLDNVQEDCASVTIQKQGIAPLTPERVALPATPSLSVGSLADELEAIQDRGGDRHPFSRHLTPEHIQPASASRPLTSSFEEIGDSQSPVISDQQPLVQHSSPSLPFLSLADEIQVAQTVTGSGPLIEPPVR